MNDNTPKNRAYSSIACTTLAVLMSVLLLSAATQTSHAFHYPWDQGHDSTDWDDPDNPGPCEGMFCDNDPSDCNGKGSPVYVATGYLNWLATDVVLNGRPYLGISRSYQSNDPRTGVFGNGWSFDHDKSLVITSEKVANTAGVTRTVTSAILHSGNGKRFQWQYNGAPDTLTSRSTPRKAPGGVFVTLSFQANGLIRITGRDGAYETFDDLGRLRTRADRHANMLKYSYYQSGDQTGLLRLIADENGRSLKFDYNNNSLVSSVVDHTDRRWTYSYDADGNLVSVADPAGGTKRYEYQSYTSNADNYTYYQLTRVVDETGVAQTSVTYDGPKVASYMMGENVWKYTYSPATRTTVKTDSLGDKHTYVYDSKGLIVKYTDGNGSTTTTKRNASGLITSVTDPLGYLWRKSFDRNGRRTSSTDALGNVTRFQYTGNAPWPVKITSPSGRVQTSRYDSKGNLLAMVDPVGAKTTLNWSKRGDLLGGEDARGFGRRVKYTATGQPREFTDELGRIRSYQYDARGNLVTITEPNGTTTTYTYDVMDRNVTATDPAGSTLGSTYDASGRLLTITDENGNTTVHSYDSYGRHIKRVGPDGRQVTITYRVDNRLNEILLEDSTKVKFSFDRGGRLTSEDIGGETISYRYNLRDELIQARNAAGSVSIEYDKNGRKTKETHNGEAITYRYNSENERVGFTALGETTTYAFTRRGHVSRITAPTGKYSFGYDPVGRRSRTSLPNGCQSDYRYDKSGGLSSIAFTGGFNATYSYQHNKAGHIRSWRGSPDGDWTYTYDANNRLTSAKNSSDDYQYRYDSSGNRLENGGVYDDANRLTQDDGFTYVYDQRGRQTRKQNKSSGSFTDYTWNHRDQLIKVELFSSSSATSPDSTLAYTYGPFGRRQTRTVDGVKETYVYDNFDRIGVKDNRNQLTSRVTFGPLIDEPLGASTPRGNRFYHSNHQGSVMALTNASGKSVARASYSPYGSTTVRGEKDTNQFWFTGRERERDDLYYYRARYYDPSAGRFLSEDPLGLGSGDTNFYSYAFSNPVNYTDPAGTCVPFTPDVVVDIGFIAYDVYRIFKDNVFGNCDNLGENLLALGADVAGACLPAATGLGAGTRLATRYGDDVLETSTRFGDELATLARKSPCGCFSGDTDVITSDGSKDIRDVVVGDKVLAWNEATGDQAFKEVTDTHRIDNHRVIYELIVESADASKSSIKVTDDHLFWTKSQEWVPSGELRPGMMFMDASGDWLRLTSWMSTGNRVPTYSIEVDEYASFYAGDQGILVHNGKPCDVPGSYPRDYSVRGRTTNRSATYNSERDARNLARTKLGRDPVQVEPNKFRSRDGRWQYRAKPNDLSGHGPGDSPHIHLERLNPNTGEVLENWHLRW